MINKLICGFLLFIIITLIILYFTGVLKKQKFTLNTSPYNYIGLNNRYINPAPLRIGNIPYSKKASNVCDSNRQLYPVYSLSPQYSEFNACDSCTQFIRPP